MTDTGLAVFGSFATDGQEAYDNAVDRFRENNIVLPTFAQLRDHPVGGVDCHVHCDTRMAVGKAAQHIH